VISLLTSGEYAVFILLLIALVTSLSFHEFGHAVVAKWHGDDTAERAGRLTVNPLAHIDPMGLLMVVLIGIGYAKPVPTDPRKFKSKTADLWVAAAGPFMNLLLALVTWNSYLLLRSYGWDNVGAQTARRARPELPAVQRSLRHKGISGTGRVGHDRRADFPVSDGCVSRSARLDYVRLR